MKLCVQGVLIKFFSETDKISIDKEMSSLVELQLKNEANLWVLTGLP